MDNGCPEKLLASKKYRNVCPDTVRRVWAECARRYPRPKEAERAAREALHGITGAFMTQAEARALEGDLLAWSESPGDATLERMLSRHASTRERLPLAQLDALWARVTAVTGRPRSVLDLACGVNPLYLGARGVSAVGVDISGAAVAAINRFHALCGAPVRATCADLLCPGAVPDERFDAALLFKLLPLVERQRPGAASRLLESVDADWLVVSFPTRTLGGRNVGMAAHYAEWMSGRLPIKQTVVCTFETSNELFYIIRR